MYTIGRICIKLAGRDAGREAVIVDILDDKFVLIDGNVRRRKCNIMHIEPTAKKIEIKKNAAHDVIAKAFKEIGLSVWETKPRKAGEKPKKIRGKKKSAEEKPVKETKKKAEKKIVKEAEIVEEKAEKKLAKKEAKKIENVEKKPTTKKKAAKKE